MPALALQPRRWEIVRVWRSSAGFQVHSRVITRVWATSQDDALETFRLARAGVGVTAPYPGELGAREES